MTGGLSRRTTLAGLTFGVAALAGCSLHTDGSATPTAAPSTPAPPSPDEAVVARAVSRIHEVAGTVLLLTRRRPSLRTELTPLEAVHLAHLHALRDTAAVTAATTAAPGARRALRQVLADEAELAEQLAYLAGRVDDGDLARLLASMAAALHQRVDPVGAAPILPALDQVTRRPPPEVDALQRALAAEHAAVYVYGVLGAQTSQSDPTTTALYAALSLDYAAHLTRRDDLIDALVAAGVAPVPSAVAYDVPQRLDRTRVVEQTARRLEASCAATYAYLVARSAGSTRRWAIAVLRNDAIRELSYRGTPETFPGAGEFADR